MKSLAFVLLAGWAGMVTAAETADHRAQREDLNDAVLIAHYPPASLAAGEQGRVIFNLSLDRDGVPTACEVTRSSGYRRLDDATCDLVLRFAVFQPNHNATGGKIAMTSEGAINWKIPGREPVAQASSKLVTTDALDRQVCRRQLKVGSLAQYERVCLTLREWNTGSVDAKAPWQALQDHHIVGQPF